MRQVIDVRQTVFEDKPEGLELPIRSLDHSDHVFKNVLAGRSRLAADHLLSREMVGRLSETVGNVIRQLNLEFLKSEVSPHDPADVRIGKIRVRQRAYEALIEIALNTVGAESKRVGFSEEEAEKTLQHIVRTLEIWESSEAQVDPSSEGPVARAVVEKFIHDMKIVASGTSMVARMAEEIEGELVRGRLAATFVLAARRAVQENVYFKMSAQGLCKFGNDYALGLRWLRHLGFVQVSTNPVLAARAYDDDSSLWDDFRGVVQGHPEWHSHPDNFGDEIVMQATMVALWPNLVVFRPIAFLSKSRDGMVSYQLNPSVAGSLEGSVEDALKIYSSAGEFLRGYDAHLMWGYPSEEERGRPNIVFKVAGESAVAGDITAAVNGMDIGTNNTVTFAVAQESTLIMAAMRGMARAKRMGMSLTQVYETNMGGRLESHIRETEAERVLNAILEDTPDKETILRKLAQGLGALEELDKTASLEEKVRIVCSSRYLKTLTDRAFVDALTAAEVGEASSEETLRSLAELEEAIGYAGTLVAQRVYRIFFSRENLDKWLTHIRREFGVSEVGAREIMDKIDILPASKRKPSDTFLTLARRNMTNTEFPNHQSNVLRASRQEGFDPRRYEDAIMRDPDPDILRKLSSIQDFRKAYEVTPELMEKFRSVGIEGELGDGGLGPDEWSSFGPVVKTMAEFRAAHDRFKRATIDFVREVAERCPSRRETAS